MKVLLLGVLTCTLGCEYLRPYQEPSPAIETPPPAAEPARPAPARQQACSDGTCLGDFRARQQDCEAEVTAWRENTVQLIRVGLFSGDHVLAAAAKSEQDRLEGETAFRLDRCARQRAREAEEYQNKSSATGKRCKTDNECPGFQICERCSCRDSN